MYSSEIERAMGCDPYTRDTVVGVYMADTIPPRNELPKGRSYGFVSNTDVHTLPGTHWTGFWEDDRTIEFYDSYGHSPGHYSDHFVKFVRDTSKMLVFNKKPIQSDYSNVCGMHVMLYLLCKARNYKLSDIVNMYSTSKEANDSFVNEALSSYFDCCFVNRQTDAFGIFGNTTLGYRCCRRRR